MPAAPKASNVVSIRVVNFSKTIFNFLTRFSMITLGKSKVSCSWHVFTVSILEVLNNFLKCSLCQNSRHETAQNSPQRISPIVKKYEQDFRSSCCRRVFQPTSIGHLPFIFQLTFWCARVYRSRLPLSLLERHSGRRRGSLGGA